MASDRRPNSILEVNVKLIRLISKNMPAVFVMLVLTRLLVMQIKESPKDIINNPTSLLILMAIGATVFTFFVRYLESDKQTDKSSDTLRAEIFELRQLLRNTVRNPYTEREVLEELRILRERFKENESKGLDLNEADKQKLFELFETKLEKNLSQEFLATVQQKFGADIVSSERYSDLLRDLLEFKERLNMEIRKLSLRANTNLSIGSVTTLIAVVVLYLTVVSNHLNFSDSISLYSYFIPRISLVIFIEVFAFFFLKLYRSNLDNIRYYHNELTNIEMKIISLKSAIINVDKSTINEVVKELSRTERNFVIKKGETTIELERLKNEKADNKSIVDFAKGIISKHTDK